MTTNDFDPTTNRIPYFLLSEGEQTALQAWPHGWLCCGGGGNEWRPINNPVWIESVVYRGKPMPVVTSKWFNVYPELPFFKAYSTRRMADDITGFHRIGVLRIDTCNGVSTAHLEGV